MPMPDGRLMIREQEARLPKMKIKVTAPMRERFNNVFGGGYADIDGKHIPAIAFPGDGKQREYEVSIATVRRLLKDQILSVEADLEALAALEAQSAGKSQSAEDVLKARLAELEAENARLKATAVTVQQPSPVVVEAPPLELGDEEKSAERVSKKGRKG